MLSLLPATLVPEPENETDFMPLIQPNASSAAKDPNESGSVITLREFYLGLLRLVFAVPLFFYQILEQVEYARGFIWSEQEWPLLEAIREMGLPQPEATAVVSIFLLAVCPAAIVIGFLTRINATLTLLGLLFFFFSRLPLSEFLNGQTYVLYMGIACVLIVSGSGNLSLDGLFAARRRRKRRLKEQADL